MKKNEIPVAQNNDFDGLVAHIQQTQDVLQNNARLVINRHVTAKAWLTGYYIVEYEQKGADRAKYGEQLLKKLAEKLKDKKTFSYRTLRLYRQFYLVYNRLGLPIKKYLCGNLSIGQSVIAKLKSSQNEGLIIWQSVIAKSSDVVGNEVWVDPQELFDKLSFTHLAAILPISDPLERAFYETMAIRGTWSVRELQRQIDSNYYFRSGWSQKPEALAKLVDGKAETDTLALDIKSPFTFEFLGLRAYYRKNIMQPDDNPPIGILLCSAVGREMAEYSLLDLDESVFISKYQLNVPSKERMTEFLRKENEGLYNKV